MREGQKAQIKVANVVDYLQNIHIKMKMLKQHGNIYLTGLKDSSLSDKMSYIAEMKAVEVQSQYFVRIWSKFD